MDIHGASSVQMLKYKKANTPAYIVARWETHHMFLLQGCIQL